MPGLAFLDLPGEIRNEIYHQLLLLPSSSSSSSNSRSHSPPRIHAAILLSNHQIHAEASSILYGLNTFEAHSTLLSSLPSLSRAYGPVVSRDAITQIRKFHLCVRLDCDARFGGEAAREAFSGIEELTVEVAQTRFASCGCDALRALEAVRGVRRARIEGSVGAFREYVMWLEKAMMTPEGAVVSGFEEGKEDVDGRDDAWAVYVRMGRPER